MKKLVLSLLLAALLLVPAGTFATRVSANSQVNRDLAAVRAATAKYHDVEAAIADGYIVPGPEHCFAVPGVGAMGIHAVNFSLVSDLEVDPLRPEVLLYVPTDEGLRLVGVEYVVAALANTPQGPQPWIEPTMPEDGFFNPAPSIFGQTFDGPMAGHEPGHPWHYDLHVWIWQDNPDGMFAQFNPNISCN